MPRRPRHAYAAAIQRGLPVGQMKTLRKFPPHRHTAGRTAPGPRRYADQAALSYSDLLRQATGEGSSTSTQITAPHGAII